MDHPARRRPSEAAKQTLEQSDLQGFEHPNRPLSARNYVQLSQQLLTSRVISWERENDEA